jgi:hypothetical protein
MRRREFITLVGGAGVWPVAVSRSNRPSQSLVFMHGRSAEDTVGQYQHFVMA